MAKRIVKPTLYNYRVVDRENGHEEIVKDVRLTYYHDKTVELLTIDESAITYEVERVELIKIA